MPTFALALVLVAAFALLTGCVIAAYTLWDKQAVDAVALSPIVYYWAGNLVVTALLTPLAIRRRDELADTWRRYRRQDLGVGLLSPAAYILVLFALTKAPVSYVAPARETSILIGAVPGATALSEGDTRRRIGGGGGRRGRGGAGGGLGDQAAAAGSADTSTASLARTGAGISAAPTRIRTNAAQRTPTCSGLLPRWSAKTASPARIADRFAATEVTAMTATPSPI